MSNGIMLRTWGVLAEDKRRLIAMLFPAMILNMIFIFIIPSLRDAGILYLLASLMAIVFLMLFEDSIGITSVGKGLAYGVLMSLFFLVVQHFVPFFTLWTPPLPAFAFAILGIGLAEQLKAVIIVYVAPVVEESLFRGAIMPAIKNIFGVGDLEANSLQAVMFTVGHFLAYGIFLGAYSHWAQLYGAVIAISGLFIAALVFGFLAGWITLRTKNLLPGIIGHGIINFILWASGFVIGLSMGVPVMEITRIMLMCQAGVMLIPAMIVFVLRLKKKLETGT